MTRALVTGAGSALGSAIAIYLAESGYGVALHSVAERNKAIETCARIVAQGGRAHLLECGDTSGSARNAIDDAQRVLGGPVTCLVNGAAVEQGGLAHTREDSSDDDIVPFQAYSLALVQAMVRQGLGVCTDAAGEPTATGAVVTLIPLIPPDCSTSSLGAKLAERGLVEMTRVAAAELAPAIRINAIGLGAALQGGRKPARDLSKSELGRDMPRPDLQSDVLVTLEYLMGASAVTGQLFCLKTGHV